MQSTRSVCRESPSVQPGKFHFQLLYDLCTAFCERSTAQYAKFFPYCLFAPLGVVAQDPQLLVFLSTIKALKASP